MKNKMYSAISVLILLLCIRPLYAGEFKIITDMDDKKIEIPINPERIACMHGASAERILILGGGSKILVSMKMSSWANYLYPEIKHLHGSAMHPKINIEEMIKLKPDLVIYSPDIAEAENMKSAGLKTVCGFSVKKMPRTIPEFMENFKRQIKFVGNLLGSDAEKRADKYCAYFDSRVSRILSITSKINKNSRPKVYYGGRSGNMMWTQGKNSVMNWNTDVSGGNFLPETLNSNFAEANLEQIFSWDPDIIMISGWCDSLDSVYKNPALASMRAAKNGRVYLIPKGIFTWDHASCEGILLMIYMAKIFYPEEFKDWDMLAEMRTFYAEIYGKNISDKDLNRILKGLPPV
jgi:iron complex transport system substrate-binding protein